MNNVPAAVPLIDPLDISRLGNDMAMSIPILLPPTAFLPIPAATTAAEHMLLAMMPFPAGSGPVLGVDDGLPQSQSRML
jgi:hypothetical protein